MYRRRRNVKLNSKTTQYKLGKTKFTGEGNRVSDVIRRLIIQMEQMIMIVKSGIKLKPY